MTQPRDVSSWLPTLLGPVDLQANGIEWPSRRKIWNFTGGVTVTDHPNDDDPMLSYTEIAISGGGGSAPASPDKAWQYRVNSTTLGADSAFTREGTGRFNVTAAGFFTIGAAGGTFPTAGLNRLESLTGDGDNTNAANYQWSFVARRGSDNLYGVGVYSYSSGTGRDLLFGAGWNWSDGNPRYDSAAFFFPVMHFKCTNTRYWVTANGQVYDDPLISQVTATDGSATDLMSLPFGGSGVDEIEVWVTGRNPAGEVAAFRFSVAYDDGVALFSGDLSPYRTRKSAGASGWTCAISAGGIVQSTSAAGVKWVTTARRQHHA